MDELSPKGVRVLKIKLFAVRVIWLSHACF